MDTDDINTAQKIWKWGIGGLAYSSTGVNGTWTTGITMDGYIVGSMISANSIVGEQIQANTIKASNLEIATQEKIKNATDVQTVDTMIKAGLGEFEVSMSKNFVTVENATSQIQQATEVAVKEATQNIIDNAVSESLESVNEQLNGKLNDYTDDILTPAIQNKAEEILNNANNYTIEKLSTYATKSEVSSGIKQAIDNINLSVSEKYETKEQSEIKIKEAINDVAIGSVNRVLGSSETKSHQFKGGSNEAWVAYDMISDFSDNTVTVSFKYKFVGTVENGSRLVFQSQFTDNSNVIKYQPTYTLIDATSYTELNVTDEVVFTTKEFTNMNKGLRSKFRFRADGMTGTLTISEAQLKIGNKITEWSIAPEDIINTSEDFVVKQLTNYSTKAETKSAIDLVKDEINLGVSSLYETKANVETQINNVKTELNTSIGEKANSVDVYNKTEVYTKAQTDSAIKIAKDSINLGVSNTYETKTNVEQKINEVAIGGVNLALGTNQGGYGWNWAIESNGGRIISSENIDGVNTVKIVKDNNNGSGWSFLCYDYFARNKILPSTDYTVSFEIKSSLNLDFHTATLMNGNGTNSLIENTKFINSTVKANDAKWTKIVAVMTTKDEIPVLISQIIYLGGLTYEANATYYLRNLKLEKGNKATDWSPAPEDLEKDINTAKNEAINSANSTLNSTIANYYTKEQTDSQINIVKDGITSSVSSLRTDIMNTSFTNLLLNSDFQYYQNGVNMPSHYESLDLVYCYGGGWLCPEGGKTIHINTVGSGRDWLGWKSHVIKASKDQVMTASVYVATDNINSFNSYLGLEIEWLNSNYERIVCSGSPFDLQSSHTWERKSVTGTAPEGTAYVRIYCWHHSEGISWWGKPMLQMGSVCTAWDKGGSLDAVEQRLYSAEQKITDTAITNTVKKNFYTKEETENAITSKGYATQSQLQQTSDSITSTVSQNHYTKQETENTINNKNFATSSQVQQTVDALQLKFTQSGGYNLFSNSGFKKGTSYWSTHTHNSPTGGSIETLASSAAWGFP